MIYHITMPDNYLQYKDEELYQAPSLQSEGFIHCSTKAQLKATCERYFSKAPAIFIICLDETKITSDIRYELATIGEEFPHIYGPINKDAIVEIKSYENKFGKFAIDIP
jgi:uncharacterized protein (DUF952 family)